MAPGNSGKIIKHLEKNNIDICELDVLLLAKLLRFFAGQKSIDENMVDGFFSSEGVFEEDKISQYVSAAFIMSQVNGVPIPNLYSVVPKHVSAYNIKCEIKAAITSNPLHTLSGTKKPTLPNLMHDYTSLGIGTEQEFEALVNGAKEELGMNNSAEGSVEDIVEPEPVFTNGSKKRQQLLEYDESELESKIKKFITAEKQPAEITSYLSEKMNCNHHQASEFLRKVVYEAVKHALWTDRSTSRNMINYLSGSAQARIAEEYIEKNSISEKIGVRRVEATKERLLKHLSLDESRLDGIFDRKLQEYAKVAEEKAEIEVEPKVITECEIKIDPEKLVCTRECVPRKGLARVLEKITSLRTFFIQDEHCNILLTMRFTELLSSAENAL